MGWIRKIMGREVLTYLVIGGLTAFFDIGVPDDYRRAPTLLLV